MIAENDDVHSGNCNSRLLRSLGAGSYVIEATTYAGRMTGSFTLLAAPVVADLLVDTNRDGLVGASDEAGEAVWTQASGVVFGPNQDDDDEDGVRDWLDATVNGDADLLDMSLVIVRRMPALGEYHSVVIEMTSGVMNFERQSVRPALFLQRADGSFEVLIGNGDSSRRATLPVAALKAGDVRLYLESALGRAHGFDGNVTLVLKVEDGDGVVARDEAALRGSPVLLSHHLQPVERLFVADASEGFHDNEAFVGAFETGLPDYADLYKMTYPEDRWTQDFMQTGYVQRPSPDGVTTDVVHVRLARGGSLGYFLPDDYLGPDAGFVFPAPFHSSPTRMSDPGPSSWLRRLLQSKTCKRPRRRATAAPRSSKAAGVMGMKPQLMSCCPIAASWTTTTTSRGSSIRCARN